jgi:DNA-binding Xre family transcriptional regulator
MGDGPSVLVTLRLSARDRALLEQLVEREHRELEDLGVEASLSSVMRKLIRAAAKASAIDVDALPRQPAPPAPASPASKTPAPSQDQVRALLRKKMAERRGLGAELARKLGVERAQVSRFKTGKEAFPTGKLLRLFEELSHDGYAESRRAPRRLVRRVLSDR